MSETSESAGAGRPEARWPKVVGIIGLILAILTLFDKAGDLLVLTMSEADWSRWLGPKVAELVVRVMPPTGWIVLTSLVWIALAILLLKASLRLRLRRRSGVELSKLWARLAIVWVFIDLLLGLLWVPSVLDELTIPAGGAWHGAAVLGVIFGLALVLVYPVFLLVWLGRAETEAESEGWAQ